jgi:hypothetical protein
MAEMLDDAAKQADNRSSLLCRDSQRSEERV